MLAPVPIVTPGSLAALHWMPVMGSGTFSVMLPPAQTTESCAMDVPPMFCTRVAMLSPCPRAIACSWKPWSETTRCSPGGTCNVAWAMSGQAA